jgi:hypothetical protein
MFIKTDGTLWAMGNNSNGQLGDGTTTNRPSPVQVAPSVSLVSANAYGLHTLFIKTDGTLWAMGHNNCGQLGDGTTTDSYSPVQVTSGVTFASAGTVHSIFIKTDTTLWGMGDNTDGELSLGGHGTGIVTVPVQVWFSNTQFVSKVAFASAGGYNTLFVTSDGTFWFLGDGYYGELGNSSETYYYYPVNSYLPNVISCVVCGDTSYFMQTANAPASAIPTMPKWAIIALILFVVFVVFAGSVTLSKKQSQSLF